MEFRLEKSSLLRLNKLIVWASAFGFSVVMNANLFLPVLSSEAARIYIFLLIFASI